jgi:predicted alpha/beta superfamily hydrolase
MTEPVVVPSTHRWTVADPDGGSGLRVTLALPPDRAKGPVHVVVLLDGDTMFLTATEFVRTVRHVSMGTFPQVAVVGIMRDEPDALRYVASRFRDFTPQQWKLHGPFEPDNAMAAFGTGGATAFLDLIEQQVLPEVQRHIHELGSTVGDTCIGGWSLSGLFAAWAWLSRPHLFRHTIAISPSLWWDDASLLATPFATQNEGRRAFVCAGECEEGDLSRVWPPIFANGEQRAMAAMVTNAERFARMASDAGATVEHVTYPGEHHITLQSAAVTQGLRFLFT